MDPTAEEEAATASREEICAEDREELAKRLDRDVDDFIAGLKKREREIIPPDQLAEELKNHPLFFKNLAEGESLPPLVEGLQQLKYSDADNTSEELASALKDDGNQAFKVANYRLAIMSYTEGIAKKCGNQQLNASLYNNRAAAHYRLKNYRSCYNDSKSALKIDPNYTKSLIRLADACMQLDLYEECVEICKRLENETGKSKEYKEMAQMALKRKNEKKRDERRRIFTDKKKEVATASVEKAIKERGIRMLNSDLANVESPLLGNHIGMVHLEDGKLVWPVVLLYPEYAMTEVIEHFHEESTFKEQLNEVFAERPEWDVEQKYCLENVNVYYEDDGEPHKVNVKSTLKTILSQHSYTVEAATPAFIILIRNSEVEKNFLAKR